MKFAKSKSFSYKTIGVAVGIGILAMSPALRAAHSRSMYEPLYIVADAAITPGQATPFDVTLQGPASLTIYSDPPGAVTYSGDMTTSEATVYASTSDDIDSDVTVYAETDGAVVVSTTDALASGPPQNGN